MLPGPPYLVGFFRGSRGVISYMMVLLHDPIATPGILYRPNYQHHFKILFRYMVLRTRRTTVGTWDHDVSNSGSLCKRLTPPLPLKRQ